MIGSQSIEQRVAVLINRLTDRLNDYHGMGTMSTAIYDTAWLAMITKPGETRNPWLFPRSLQYILDTQQDDGGWPSYASKIDGILNTAASLLCLRKHYSQESEIVTGRQELQQRIDRAIVALQRLLDEWDVASTVHVGFEVLVPALLKYLEAEGISFAFPQSESLQNVNQQKLRKFKPEYLYGKAPLTALHSLEAFVGLIDFDKVAHHKVRGSFMASPSSTAAYLMHASQWDEDCEIYLREVVQHSAGLQSGAAPSAWPSTTFEVTWVSFL